MSINQAQLRITQNGGFQEILHSLNAQDLGGREVGAICILFGIPENGDAMHVFHRATYLYG